MVSGRESKNSRILIGRTPQARHPMPRGLMAEYGGLNDYQYCTVFGFLNVNTDSISKQNPILLIKAHMLQGLGLMCRRKPRAGPLLAERNGGAGHLGFFPKPQTLNPLIRNPKPYKSYTP